MITYKITKILRFRWFTFIEEFTQMTEFYTKCD